MIEPGAAPRSMLIVLTGALGDVARGFAILTPLKRAWPDVKVTWLIEKKWRDVVTLHPGVDEIVMFDRSKRLRGFLEVRRELKARRFDVTLDLQRNFKSGVFCRWSNAARRIGFHRSDAKEFNWIFQTETILAYGDQIPKLDHYLHFVRHLGVEPGAVDFGVSHLKLGDLAPALAPQLGEKYIGLVLGSSWRSKNWVDEGYEGLVPLLASLAPQRVVLLGDKSQIMLAEKLERLAPACVVNLAGKTTLRELLGVIRGSSYCIGPDSGPGHLSSLFGVPYISLFGPTPPTRVAPHGSHHLVIKSAIGCSPCGRRECPGLGTLCMRLIRPEVVFEKAKELAR